MINIPLRTVRRGYFIKIYQIKRFLLLLLTKCDIIFVYATCGITTIIVTFKINIFVIIGGFGGVNVNICIFNFCKFDYI